MESFLTRYLHGNTTQVHVRGSSFGPDDSPSRKHVGNTPPWLQKALERIIIRVPFPGAKETQLIQSLELTGIKIDFSIKGDPLISADAVAMLKKPEEMQFHMDVTQIEPHVFLYLDQSSEKPFATVQPNQPCPATTEEGNGIDLPLQTMRVKSKLVRAPFKVLPGGQKDFEAFLNRVFYGKKSKIYIRGTSDATVDSDFGHLNIKDLEFNGEIETKGLRGMQHPPPQINSITITKGHIDALQVQTELSIHSPADVDVNLGELNMALLYEGHVIGNTSIPELKLSPGLSNKLLVSAWLFGDNDYVTDFIGNYISKGTNLSDNNVTLTISGQHSNATRSVFLKEFLKHINFNVQAPPFDKEPLLADCQMYILSSTVIMSLRNPFNDIEMAINKINASATYEEYEVGTINANFEDRGEGWKNGPMKLPPPSCDNSEKHCTGVVVNSEKIPIATKKLGYEAIKKALGGSIDVSVASEVSVMIDKFKLNNLRYHQSNITAKVRKGF
ncbi:hypothetical protein BDF20DRAFT_908014 [Mycotypha africana]|uniref:uncharacterized protein n=1 Tax=Mycotypha africana TaxID=64632 RepID=UPI00230021AC|nr:uncharacterized protein BDF20DRAFT_908014 [Mycotypha africana]KAI8968172.1 hypothetical protein BDF20DRAFT_908014 [Mycotypha africana]